MKMINRAVLCAALISAGSFASAFDFGGVISNNSTIKTNAGQDFKLDQTDTAALWFRAPIVKNESTESYVAGQGTYSFERDFNKSETIQYVDLDLLKFVYRKIFDSSEVEVSAGRFFTSDLSGLVFSQKADGVNLNVKTAKVEITAYGAYTGLLNAQADTLLSYDLTKLSADTDKLYDLAEKNAVGIVCLKFPSLFVRQTAYLQGVAAVRLQDEDYNRFYGTAGFSGPLGTLVYYDINSTFGFTKFDSEDYQTANLSKASVTVFPQKLSSSVSVNGVYASGNQGSFKPFRGVTGITAYESLDEPVYSGIVKAGISATCKPVSALLLSASFDAVLNAAAGDKADEIEYKGLQFAAGADWQLLSDFSVGVRYTQYNDKDDSDINRKKISLKACLKF